MRIVRIIALTLALAAAAVGPVSAQTQYNYVGTYDYGRITLYQQGRGNYAAVISPTYKTDRSGRPIVNQWYLDGDGFRNRANLFDIFWSFELTEIDTPQVSLRYSPVITTNGTPLSPVNARLNGVKDTIIVDYGPVKRYLKLYNGGIMGWWELPQRAEFDTVIRYNQSGNARLSLGEFATDKDTETILRGTERPGDNVKASSPGRAAVLKVTDSMSFNPDGSPGSTVDGNIYYYEATGQTWTYYVNASTGGGAHYTLDGSDEWNSAYYQHSSAGDNTWRYLRRWFCSLDTSAISDNAVITSAEFKVYGNQKADPGGDTPDIAIYDASLADPSVLAPGDYDCSTGTLYSDSIGYSAFNTSGYNTFTLNAAGIAAVNKSGMTEFSIRFVKDASDTVPAHNNGVTENTYMAWYHAEKGAGYEPTLTVYYTMPSPPSAPAALDLAVVGVDTITANWTPVGSATYYQLWTSYENADVLSSGYMTYNGTATSCNVSGLDLNSTVYYFGVRAINASGASGFTLAQIGGTDMSIGLDSGTLIILICIALLVIALFFRDPYIFILLLPACYFAVIQNPGNDAVGVVFGLMIAVALIGVWATRGKFKKNRY